MLLREANQESHAEESAEKLQLVIDEADAGKEVVESLAGLEAQCSKSVRGFGEIDVGDSPDEAVSESASGEGSSDNGVLVCVAGIGFRPGSCAFGAYP